MSDRETHLLTHFNKENLLNAWNYNGKVNISMNEAIIENLLNAWNYNGKVNIGVNKTIIDTTKLYIFKKI